MRSSNYFEYLIEREFDKKYFGEDYVYGKYSETLIEILFQYERGKFRRKK